MIIDKFTDEEIDSINKFCIDNEHTIDRKRTYIQEIIVNRSLKNSHKKIVLCLFTGFGKTRTAIQYTDRFRTKFPFSKIRIVVPTTNLKKDWAIKRDYFDINVINSFTMKLTDEERKSDFLIVDEVHHALGENSKFFSKALDYESTYKLGLSASLTEKNFQLLREKLFDYIFVLTVEDGKKLNIVPEHKIYHIPISLTNSERMLYHNNEQELMLNSKLFTTLIINYSGEKEFILRKLCFSILKKKSDESTFFGHTFKTDELIEFIFNKLKDNKISINNKSVIIGIAKKVNANFLKRDSMLDNAQLKVDDTISLINKIKNEGQEIKNVLIFSKSVSFIEVMNNRLIRNNIPSVILHSKLPNKQIIDAIQGLREGRFKIMLSIGMVKEGFDLDTCDTIIRTAYNGTILDAEQIIGRAIRLDKNNSDKIANIYNFYVDTFTYRETVHQSVEAGKLEYAYKNYDVEWLDYLT
jgi:superfamily II DNA or RNA helicase